jgi:hypothetical protein
MHEPDNGKSHWPRRSAQNGSSVAAAKRKKGKKRDKEDKDADVFTAFLDALHEGDHQ